MINESKVFLIYETYNGELAMESVWATKIGEYFRIKNIPFFAKNIALGDLVKVELDDGKYFFEKLISESGWSTIQVVILKVESLQEIIKNIESVGATWEGIDSDSAYVTLGIPPSVEYAAVSALLDSMASTGMIDYKEVCISTVHRKK